jgi:hypothetical protein
MSRGAPSDKAVVTVYGGKKITIDNKSFKEYPHKGGGLLSGYQLELTLEPGEHTFCGDYLGTSNLGKTNITAKNIELTANLQAGKSYDIGLFESGAELDIAIAAAKMDKRDWHVILRLLED